MVYILDMLQNDHIRMILDVLDIILFALILSLIWDFLGDFRAYCARRPKLDINAKPLLGDEKV